jgi:hypothetical protein
MVDKIKEYYENHKVCPKCKCKDYEKTLVAYIVLGKDLNRVHCSCGFIGIVDDLVKE